MFLGEHDVKTDLDRELDYLKVPTYSTSDYS